MQLRAELARSQQASLDLQHERAAFAAAADAAAGDRRAAEGAITRLEALVKSLTQQLNTTAGALAGCQSELHSSRQDAAASEARCAALIVQIEQARDALARSEAFSSDVQAQLRRAEAEAATLRPVVRQQSDDNSTLRQRWEAALSETGELSERLRLLSAERAVLQQRVVDADASAAASAASAETLQKDTAALKDEVERLTSSLQAAQGAAMAARSDAERLVLSGDVSASRVEVLESEIRKVMQRLSEEADRAAQAEARCARLESAVGVAAEVPLLRSELSSTNRTLAESESQRILLEHNRNLADSRCAELSREVASLRSALDVATAAKNEVARELTEQRASCESSELQLRTARADLEHKMAMLGASNEQICELRDVEASLKRQLQDALSQAADLRSTCEYERARTATAEHALAAAHAESARYSAEAATSDAQRAKSERLQDEARLQAEEALRQCAAARGEAVVLRNRAEAAGAEAASAEARAGKSAARTAELEASVAQLRALLVQVDHTCEATSEQLSAALSRLKNAERENADLVSRLARAQESVAAANASQALLASELKLAAEERVAVEQRVAAAAAQLADAQAEATNHLRAVSGAQMQITSLRDECARLAAAVADRDEQLRAAFVRAEVAETRVDDAVAAYESSRQELVAAAGDIAALSHENQAVAGAVTAEREQVYQLRMALDAAKANVANLEARCGVAESRHKELLTMYESVLEERRALLAEVDAGEVFRAHLQQQAASLTTEVGSLQAALESEATSAAQAREEAASLGSTLQAALRDVESARVDLSVTVSETTSAARDADYARQTLASLMAAVTTLRAQLHHAQVCRGEQLC
jgi:chromosome segregation ATPase